MRHTELNNQEITAIFSHLSRNINHREIGYIRDTNNPKYAKYPTLTKPKTDEFLARYNATERNIRKSGLLPNTIVETIIEKAIDAMRSAIALYNSPSTEWKSEAYLTHSVIAWTYLFHAKLRSHEVDVRYKHKGTVKLSPSGQPMLWEASKCLKHKITELEPAEEANLRYIIEMRHLVEHHPDKSIGPHMAPKLQANAINFNNRLVNWFGEQYSLSREIGLAIQLVELTVQQAYKKSSKLPKAISTANKLIEAPLTPEQYNDPRYSMRVWMIPKTVRNVKGADRLVHYAPAGSDIEMAVREVERPKYRATDIVAILNKEGHTKFSLQKRDGFVPLWKSLGAKRPGRGYGVEIGKSWFWYDKMLSAAREYCQKNNM